MKKLTLRYGGLGVVSASIMTLAAPFKFCAVILDLIF